jgi:CMP-N,N'-diacetyllegionaminic acid synthase
MLNNKTFLAIIPARGGSKRLPKKNVLELVGKPLIAWTIEAALKSKHIDKVLVTSDDDEILDVSEKFGAATIPRPADIAQDTSTSFEAIRHAIESMEKYDYVVLLQPTSPLRTSQHIEEAIQLLVDRNADAIISVTEMEHSPLWVNVLPGDNCMAGFLREEILNKRSQDLETYYRLNGAIYISQTTKLMDAGSFFLSNNVYAYKMSNTNSVDIDTEMDFKWAEFLLNSVANKGY